MGYSPISAHSYQKTTKERLNSHGCFLFVYFYRIIIESCHLDSHPYRVTLALVVLQLLWPTSFLAYALKGEILFFYRQLH